MLCLLGRKSKLYLEYKLRTQVWTYGIQLWYYGIKKSNILTMKQLFKKILILNTCTNKSKFQLSNTKKLNNYRKCCNKSKKIQTLELMHNLIMY